jgi:hypothetical protein
MAPRITPDGVIRVRSLAGRRGVVGDAGVAVGDGLAAGGAVVATVARVADIVLRAVESAAGAPEQPGANNITTRTAVTERIRDLSTGATMSAEQAGHHRRMLGECLAQRLRRRSRRSSLFLRR